MAAQTADEILEQAKRLPADERRRVAEELLDELDQAAATKSEVSEGGPYAKWLHAAGSVHSDFDDLSTDKYKHVAAAAISEHHEA